MANPFSPSPDDGAIEILRMIFGPVIDNVVAQSTIATAASSSTTNMLGEAFRYFNSGVMFFTVIIMTWVTTFGIANSANDGEVLGKKWSTFYTPLRTFGASFMLIPTASGYSIVQVTLLLITSWSIGFASNMWRASLEFAYTDEVADIAVKSVIDDKTFEELAMNAIRMQVCAYSVTKAYQAVTGNTNFQMQLTTPQPQTSSSLTGDYKTIISDVYYASPDWPASAYVCGRVRITDTFDVASTNTKTTNDTVRNLHDAIVKVRYNYTKDLFDPNKALAPIVKEIIRVAETDGATIDPVSKVSVPLEKLRMQMTADIRAAVISSLKGSQAGVIAKLGDKGWIYAGALYKEIGTIKDAVSAASKSEATYSVGADDVAHALSGDYLKIFAGVTARYDVVAAEVSKKALAVHTTASKPGPEKIQTSFTKADFADGGTSVFIGIKHVLNFLPDSIVQIAVMHLSETDGDPIWAIKDMGDGIRFVVEGTILTKNTILSSLTGIQVGTTAAAPGAGGLAAIVAAPLAGIIAGGTKFIALTWEEMKNGVYVALYLAYFLSIWVPAMPFFIFTVGVAGWVVFIIEMLAAGSLWMAAHTTPAREDSFIGSQTQGYMLVMSGFFRPAFMVMGLIASIVVTKPLVQYLNSAFVLMFRSNTSDSYIGITGVAGYLMLYCTILFAILSLIFALPQSLPDRVLRWVGAGIGDMGEQGTMGKIENASSGHARAAQHYASSRGDASQRAKDNQLNEARQAKRDSVQEQIMSSLSEMSRGGLEGQGGQRRTSGTGPAVQS